MFIRVAAHAALAILLTALTQLGGPAWLIALRFRHRVLAFAVLYAVFSAGAFVIAPAFGRVPLPCFEAGSLRAQSALYCVLNRHYVVPELRTTAIDLAAEMANAFPGTKTLYLDAGFPFFDGFVLLPHLSHDDGQKLDLAFYYRRNNSYLPGETRSPVGYFAFESGPTDCEDRWATLRWNLDWLQPLFANLNIDVPRMQHLLQTIVADHRISRVFLEPHLVTLLDVESDKIRFQGCRAARHDDHLHLEVNGG